LLTAPRGKTRHQLADYLSSTTAQSAGTLAGRGFDAELFVEPATSRLPAWEPFVRTGFPGAQLARSTSSSALLVVRTHPTQRLKRLLFAFPFGPAGRFMLDPDTYERGYGLHVALNAIYPKGSVAERRLRAVDSKRHAAETTRTRTQVAGIADFDAFGVSRLQDVVDRAIGRPMDEKLWGTRVGGADSVTFNVDLRIDDIGDLCRRIERFARRRDYQAHFAWIDNIQPVEDPALVEKLTDQVIARLRARITADIDLAPPEIVEWDRLADFHYSFDRPQGRAKRAVTHPDLRIDDYLSGLSRTGSLAILTADTMRGQQIHGLDAQGERAYEWSPWKCIVAEFQIGCDQYLLEEGSFFRVNRDYLDDLDQTIDAIPRGVAGLPASTRSTIEAAYNKAAAESCGCALLDRRLVNVDSRATAIEICDLLTASGQLIHVKRKLGSRDLSHMFAQGLVSAELLQTHADFRAKAQSELNLVTADPRFADMLNPSSLNTSSFEVVYGVIADWKQRSPAKALPFFSKVNLREVATNLQTRGFRVGIEQIDV
jgi:uncharacterized protein (TIGR04141 family)